MRTRRFARRAASGRGAGAGGRFIANPKEEAWGAIRALDSDTGNWKWEFRLHSPPWAGLLTTAGGLVFGGANGGHWLALGAKRGKQHAAFAAGHYIFVFALEPGGR